MLVLEGHARVRPATTDFGVVGSRASVFDGPPPPVILVAPGSQPSRSAPRRSRSSRSPRRPAAPFAGRPHRARRHPRRGPRAGQHARRVHHLLPPAAEAGRLIAFEVFTPGGQLVELSAPQARHRGPAARGAARGALLLPVRAARRASPSPASTRRTGRLDEALTPGDGDLVLVPEGYHPVGVPAGYDCYYLNVMAGPNRAWHFTLDPDHAWLMDWDRRRTPPEDAAR